MFLSFIYIFKEFYIVFLIFFFFWRLIFKVAFLCSEIVGEAFGPGDGNGGTWGRAKN